MTVIDPRRNKVTARIDLGRPLDPFGVTFNADATKAYVTNWTGRSVAVIDTARERGYRRVLLETGTTPGFAAARALYESAGFVPTGPFGGYPETGDNCFYARAL